MGLGLSHGSFSWSYTSFHQFRSKLAEAIGISDYRCWLNLVNVGIETIWDKDPLFNLLHHPDSEGNLSSRQCRIMAPRIRRIISEWPDSKNKKLGEDLTESMDLAASEDSPLVFC